MVYYIYRFVITILYDWGFLTYTKSEIILFSFQSRVIRQQIHVNSLVHSFHFQEFPGNFDGNKVVSHVLLPKFTANLVRFTPKECKAADLCCMRVEIYVSGENNEKLKEYNFCQSACSLSELEGFTKRPMCDATDNRLFLH